MRLTGTLIGATAPAERSHAGQPLRHRATIARRTSLTGIAATALLRPRAGRRRPVRLPDPHRPVAHATAPARSRPRVPRRGPADGPETPSQVQLNKAMIGFLSHTGFAHGGTASKAWPSCSSASPATVLADLAPAHGLDSLHRHGQRLCANTAPARRQQVKAPARATSPA